MAATPAHAEVTLTVTTTADSGPGSLREALAQAEASASDDHISFAPSVSGTIQLTGGELDVAVGGASGSLVVEGPGSDVLAVDAGGRSRVLDVHGPGGDTRPTILVSGLTLTGGASSRDQDLSFSHGGAIHALGTDLTVHQVVVSDNRAYDDGGGVAVEGGTLVVAASMITGNSAGSPYGSGGGIHVDSRGVAGATLTVRDSTISDNRAGPSGGGINVWGPAPVTVTASTLSRNTARHVFSGMEVYIVEGVGGGIAADRLTVVDSRVTDNEAGDTGGGLSGRSVTVARSTIADNDGGGIHVPVQSEDELRLDSSTVTGNRDFGISLGSNAPAVLRLSTVAVNDGPGVYSNGGVTLQGTVVGMNVGGDLAGAGSATLTHSLVQEPRGFAVADDGGAIIGQDPRLGPLADHGGPTPTMLPAPNSPVIDAGAGFGSATDQRGSSRPVDDADSPDAADGSDIGAVELTAAEQVGPPQVGSTARPIISGRLRVGETLQTDGGTWEPGDVSLSYQWLRNGVPIDGATSSSYILTSSDYDRYMYGYGSPVRMSVRVTAAAAGHHPGVRVSDYTDHVRKGRFEVSRPARLTGRVRVGSVLRADPRVHAVSPRPRRVTILWFLGGQLVQSAVNERRLELTPRMRGKRVRVEFTYRRAAYVTLVQEAQARRRVR